MPDPLAQCLAECGGEKYLFLPAHTERKTVELFQIWQDVNNGQYEINSIQKDVDLLARPQGTVQAGNLQLLVQVAFIGLLPSRMEWYLDLSREKYLRLLEIFELEELRNLAQTSPSTFDVLPEHQDGKLINLGCSAFVSNWMGFYCVDKTQDPTYAVVWSHEVQLGHLKRAMTSLVDLASHPCYLLLALSTTLISYTNQGFSKLHPVIGAVEQRSGHQPFLLGVYPNIDDDFSTLSAKVSGIGGKVASLKRFAGLVGEILISIDEITQSESCTPDTTAKARIQSCRIKMECRKLERRMKMQLLQAEYTNTRIDKQLTALFNLVTKADTDLSLKVAKSSRTLADAAKRDSSSMKILAAVTVLFLPATFIASLFSTTMFDWHVPAGSIVSEQFWIYWVTVIPLTFAVIAICFFLTEKWRTSAQWQDELAAQDFHEESLSDRRPNGALLERDSYILSRTQNAFVPTNLSKITSRITENDHWILA